jgi:NAD(P)-dependent dehydrogenase (short-subunit alcohol dehydrogenase family)
MSGKLSGKIALVTGGSAGIGLAVAGRFTAEGAYVFITGRRQTELDRAVQQIGVQAVAIRCDVADLDALDRVYRTIERDKGRLDILVANAGGGEFVPLEAVTEEHFDKTFDTNVKGTLFSVQKALPLLTAGGSIILIGSNTSVKGTPAFSVYSASKAAVRSFARSWAQDLKHLGIRVNTLSPGPTQTPGLSALAVTEQQAGDMQSALRNAIPLGRLGAPDEIASAALFLASGESSFVTGIELFVDGGMSQI